MSDWAAKRFWKQAQVVTCDGGFSVELDGRAVKTPAKALLVVPTHDMAIAIAAEWDAQEGVIDPRTMPVTRGANAAIDKVTTQRAEVVEMLAAYGDSDLLCYRAAGPEELVALQAANWDPLLEWYFDTHGGRLWVGEGVMHVPQDPAILAHMTTQVAALDPFALAAAHDLISLSGSLVIALAVLQGHITPEDGWRLSRIDEDWQITQWGHDDDAAAQTMIKRAAFLDAARFYFMTLT